MGTVFWLVVGGVVVVLAIVGLVIWRGYGATLLNAWSYVWGSPVGRHVLVILGVLLVFQGGIKNYTQHVAEEKASEWLTSYNGSATTEIVGPIKASVPGLLTPSASPTAAPPPSPTPTPTPTPAATPSPVPVVGSTANPTPSPTPTEAEQKRLDAQLRTIRDRTKHHADVMAYFYVNYFVAIVMVMCAGLVVAATLFFIAQGGWTGTNSYVRAIFILVSAIGAFYGLFPPVFEQPKNIADNKQLFLEYKTLESEVESYPVTYTTIKNEPKTAREFINHIDSEMDRLGNIALGFDISKITYQQAFDVGKRPTPAPTGTPPGGNGSPR